MSARFFIRKFSSGYHRWSLRDALCPNGDRHDFYSSQWSDECDGACDTFRYFKSAIATADENK